MLTITVPLEKKDNSMKTYDEKYHIAHFLTKFYDKCSEIECSNITLDEFYQEFPVEMHDFIQKTVENMKKEVKNA